MAVTVPRNISSGAALQVGTGSLGVVERIPPRREGKPAAVGRGAGLGAGWVGDVTEFQFF